MPLPKPNDGENQEAFIARCMSEIADEFPDEAQRAAVCHAQWHQGRDDKPSMEWRGLADDVELRADDEDGPRIQGYAAVFNKLSQPLGFGFREKIMPGAFAETIKRGDVRALFNHDPNHVLGRTKSGTLTLEEDDVGLRYDIRPPDEPWVRGLITSIKRGDITQSSFAFQAISEQWSESGKTRELREVRLFDVSPVTYPAYLDTVVQARSVRQAVEQALTAMRADPAQSQSSASSEPGEAHSESGADPAQSQSEPVTVRPMSILVREWSIAKQAGEATLNEGGTTE